MLLYLGFSSPGIMLQRPVINSPLSFYIDILAFLLFVILNVFVFGFLFFTLTPVCLFHLLVCPLLLQRVIPFCSPYVRYAYPVDYDHGRAG